MADITKNLGSERTMEQSHLTHCPLLKLPVAVIVVAMENKPEMGM